MFVPLNQTVIQYRIWCHKQASWLQDNLVVLTFFYMKEGYKLFDHAQIKTQMNPKGKMVHISAVAGMEDVIIRGTASEHEL